jgi:hypothetical protein
MVGMTLTDYTSEVGLLGLIRPTCRPWCDSTSELQDEIEKEWNAPAIKNGRFVICLESQVDGHLTTVLIINGKFAENSHFIWSKLLQVDLRSGRIITNTRKWFSLADRFSMTKSHPKASV